MSGLDFIIKDTKSMISGLRQYAFGKDAQTRNVLSMVAKRLTYLMQHIQDEKNSLKNITQSPQLINGNKLPNKFIAIDSSGERCALFYKKGDVYFDAGAVEGICDSPLWDDWFESVGYMWFIPISEKFLLWGERLNERVIK